MCEPTGQRAPCGSSREVGEVVRLGECRVVALGRERERCAARPASDHLRREAEAALRIGAPVRPLRLLVEEAPEAVDVLAQLAEDEVGAVARQVGASVEERLVRVPAVLVRVAEDELAEAQRGLRRALLRQALDERLRDAVAEAEGLVAVEVRGVEPREDLQAGAELGASARARGRPAPPRRGRRGGAPRRRPASAGRPSPSAPARSRRRRRGRGVRCGAVIPSANSFAKRATVAASTPSFASPERVSAMLTACVVRAARRRS